MAIILVGLNHQTAPVALREQLSLSGCALDMALQELGTGESARQRPDGTGLQPNIHESVILSTCNRLEIVATTGDPATGFETIPAFLAGLQGLSVDSLRPHLYFLDEQAAVEHLMRVAAGLESMILGEPQILGQVAAAFASAQGAGTTGLVLSQLFARAVHAGKRARSETAISRHTTSMSHAAAHLAVDAYGDLRDANVLIVGAGEMAEIAATALYEQGARRITCINRTYARAEWLARRFEGDVLAWSHLSEALAAADVIVTATGAPHTVIFRDHVAQVLSSRAGRPLVIVDIALPRDVEPATGDLPGVTLYDMDQLQEAVDANLTQRKAAVPQVEVIVREEAGEFFCWLAGRQVVPVLVDLRRKVEAMAKAELDSALRLLDSSDPRTEQAMTLLTHRLVRKLLHEPTVRLKTEAANGNGIVYADALRELFALNGGERLTGSTPGGDVDAI